LTLACPVDCDPANGPPPSTILVQCSSFALLSSTTPSRESYPTGNATSPHLLNKSLASCDARPPPPPLPSIPASPPPSRVSSFWLHHYLCPIQRPPMCLSPIPCCSSRPVVPFEVLAPRLRKPQAQVFFATRCKGGRRIALR
jgi:hypothetical protein